MDDALEPAGDRRTAVGQLTGGGGEMRSELLARHARWQRVKLVAITGLILTLLTTTALGQSLGDRWWVAELFTNLPVQHVFGFALALLAAVHLRRRLLITGAAFGLAVNLAIAAPVLITTYFGEQPRPAIGATSLEVTFFNSKFDTTPEATVEQLRFRADDIVVLALASDEVVDAVAASLQHLELRTGSGSKVGEDLELATFVRDPEARVRVHRLSGDPRDAVVEVIIDLDGDPVYLLVAHPVSPLTPGRAARRDTVLAWIQEQVELRTGPTVVVGDLNATPWSPRLRQLQNEGDLLDSQMGHGKQASYPALLGPLGISIDHLLHSPDLTTMERRLGPSLGSDHRMLHVAVARSEIPPPAARGPR